MGTAAASKCDRCGVEALGYPSYWGIVKITRPKPFLSTGDLDLCGDCFNTAYSAIRAAEVSKAPAKRCCLASGVPPHSHSLDCKVRQAVHIDDLVMVHADGGACHGTRLVNNQCPKCGIIPDMQSTELWPPGDVKR